MCMVEVSSQNDLCEKRDWRASNLVSSLGANPNMFGGLLYLVWQGCNLLQNQSLEFRLGGMELCVHDFTWGSRMIRVWIQGDQV